MAKTSPEPDTRAASGELAHGSLRLWDAIEISVSADSPRHGDAAQRDRRRRRGRRVHPAGVS